MTISGYISGIVGLLKDFIRFGFGLLKRPHYVAAIIVVILGVFYLNGISPREIPKVVRHQWDSFVANRKQVFSEELQSISQRIDDENNPLKQTFNKLSDHIKKEASSEQKTEKKPLFVEPEKTVQEQHLFEENFGWQKSFQEISEKEPVDVFGKESIQGILTVIGATQVRIGDRVFSLKVKLRPGKAG